MHSINRRQKAPSADQTSRNIASPGLPLPPAREHAAGPRARAALRARTGQKVMMGIIPNHQIRVFRGRSFVIPPFILLNSGASDLFFCGLEGSCLPGPSLGIPLAPFFLLICIFTSFEPSSFCLINMTVDLNHSYIPVISTFSFNLR